MVTVVSSISVSLMHLSLPSGIACIAIYRDASKIRRRMEGVNGSTRVEPDPIARANDR
jgi:hypothetical protein